MLRASPAEELHFGQLTLRDCCAGHVSSELPVSTFGCVRISQFTLPFNLLSYKIISGNVGCVSVQENCAKGS